MSVLNKFKLRNDIKQQLEKQEEERSGGRKKDSRILPYYDMKFGEKVKVLIVPDTNGNLWKKYSSHGSNMKIRGLAAIGCRRNNDHEECPICQRGFDLLQESKDQNDASLKDEAKRWFPKDTTVMSVLVLEAPFEVPISDDCNEVKLMYLPYAIESLIKNALAEGQLDEDSILSTPLWIKKSVKKGTKDTPDYSASFFDRLPVTDDELEAFEDSVVEAYDYDNFDLVPDSPSYEEAEEWLNDAIMKDDKQKSKASGSTTARGDNKQPDGSSVKLKSAAERLKEKRAAQQDESEEYEAEEHEAEEQQHEPQPENSTKSRAQALRERLAKQRAGG